MRGFAGFLQAFKGCLCSLNLEKELFLARLLFQVCIDLL